MFDKCKTFIFDTSERCRSVKTANGWTGFPKCGLTRVETICCAGFKPNATKFVQCWPGRTPSPADTKKSTFARKHAARMRNVSGALVFQVKASKPGREQDVSSLSEILISQRNRWAGRLLRVAAVPISLMLAGARAFAEEKPSLVPNMFAPTSTPAHEEFVLAMFVLGMTLGIFVIVGAAWLYVVIRYRSTDPSPVEPPQVYGSPQVELAWTIVPLVAVIVLFLTTARMIFSIEDHPKPRTALDVTVVGHQFWWEYRYPQYGVVVANELHVPMSTPGKPTPTFMKLLSADVWHSYWVPQLAGKVDNIPDHVNQMWIEPTVPGVYVGQCGQFCGAQHAKMLIRVYVDTPDQFRRWITEQQQPAVEVIPGQSQARLEGQQGGRLLNAAFYQGANGTQAHPGGAANDKDNAGTVAKPGSRALGSNSGFAPNSNAPGAGQPNSAAAEVAAGRQVFMTNACINCHAIRGTVANGRFGPDLTHFGGRDNLGSGILPNSVDNLRTWIRNPSDVKEGALMPPMQLSETQLKQVSVYLSSLK